MIRRIPPLWIVIPLAFSCSVSNRFATYIAPTSTITAATTLSTSTSTMVPGRFVSLGTAMDFLQYSVDLETARMSGTRWRVWLKELTTAGSDAGSYRLGLMEIDCSRETLRELQTLEYLPSGALARPGFVYPEGEAQNPLTQPAPESIGGGLVRAFCRRH